MPLLDLFFAMFIIFWWVMWIWLLITVFIDIFRDETLNGVSKALWVVLVLVLPLLGVLAYLIGRGTTMHERQAKRGLGRDQATRHYIQGAAGPGQSAADELSKLAQLHSDGVLTDEEFDAQKAKTLG